MMLPLVLFAAVLPQDPAATPASASTARVQAVAVETPLVFAEVFRAHAPFAWRCLRRLGVEHIDLFQLHGFDPTVATDEVMGTLADLVRSSLRLRPDRIPIGEVRAAMAADPRGRAGSRNVAVPAPWQVALAHRCAMARTLRHERILGRRHGRGADRQVTTRDERTGRAVTA